MIMIEEDVVIVYKINEKIGLLEYWDNNLFYKKLIWFVGWYYFLLDLLCLKLIFFVLNKIKFMKVIKNLNCKRMFYFKIYV